MKRWKFSFVCDSIQCALPKFSKFLNGGIPELNFYDYAEYFTASIHVCIGDKTLFGLLEPKTYPQHTVFETERLSFLLWKIMWEVCYYLIFCEQILN